MLILQRRPGESLRIGDDIEVTVMAIEGGRARLAITAPADVTILRSELIQAREANRDSVMEQTVSAELLSMLEDALPVEESPLVSEGGRVRAAAPLKPVVTPHEVKRGEKSGHPNPKGGNSV